MQDQHDETTSPSSSTAASGSASEFKRTPLVIALVLSVLLVVGVLVGAKVAFDNAAKQPVALGMLNTPEAESPQCAQLLTVLPHSLGGHERAEIADPVPPGAAAWQSSSTERFTLRCGVTLPLQYTDLSVTSTVDGVEWLKVMDTTPQSTMQTWYVVNKTPVVGITTDQETLNGEDFPAAELSQALNTLEDQKATPFETPLANLALADNARCEDLLAHLPDTIGEDVQYSRFTGELPQDLVAWVADGYEPIALRCGVEFPQNYEAGAQLQSINDVPWFEDTTLGNGTTASTWFALGRDVDVAVSTPQAPAQAALTKLSEIIKAHTGEQ